MKKHLILLITAGIGLIILFFIGPIPQDPAYHAFADTQTIVGIPNFYNVVSNLPFIIIGIWGLTCIRSTNIILSIKTHYIVFCIGVFLVGLGSAFYHLRPDNASLVWDRLPMTIAFMSFFSALISEYIDTHLGKMLLLPLLLLGIFSVIYWAITESMGIGDLRPYTAVQYIPLVLTPLILILYEPDQTYRRYAFWGLVFYGLAKIVEVFDSAIFSFFKMVISGHMAKHFFAAAGSFFILKMFLNPKSVCNDTENFT